jgi:hypothetical protein
MKMAMMTPAKSKQKMCFYTSKQSSRFSVDSQSDGINKLEIKFAAENPQTETDSSGLNTGTAIRHAKSFATACVRWNR